MELGRLLLSTDLVVAGQDGKPQPYSFNRLLSGVCGWIKGVGTLVMAALTVVRRFGLTVRSCDQDDRKTLCFPIILVTCQRFYAYLVSG